ncbi:N-myristoyl transferase [Fistulina hepatica ATCC 64428]|nr:N-myristoyl transferase [Fistulina hepatica ATCC 64428]
MVSGKEKLQATDLADDEDTSVRQSEEQDGSQSDTSDVPAPSTSASTSQKKKKKKKSKAAKVLAALRSNGEIPQELVDRVLGQVRGNGGEGSDATEETIRQALQQLNILEVAKGTASLGGHNRKDMGNHKFWGTQPVPQPGEGPPLEDGYIEPSVPREEVRQDAYPLPNNFEWTILDLDDETQIKEVYDLLSMNYVEDKDASFRFQYSAEFLQWLVKALKPPGYHKEWHLGVRVASSKRLVAFISGVPITLRIRKHTILASEINYLCVHKKLRSKRLAPVLIKEVTRQVHLKGIFQAIYTGGVVLPTPVATCRYFHRSLNIPKLVQVGFTYVPRNMTVARMVRVNKVPETTATPGLREMEDCDVPQVIQLFSKYMRRFDMLPIMTTEEARHNFLSGRGTGESVDGRRERQVTWTYVVEDPQTDKITDFFSFYSLPSSIIGNEKHAVLYAAYLYYYATDTAFTPDAEASGALKTRLRGLIGDALIVANNAKFDVFNALTLMDNVPILADLKFGQGDGLLNFYLYNWRTAPLAAMNTEGGVEAGKGVGVVML